MSPKPASAASASGTAAPDEGGVGPGATWGARAESTAAVASDPTSAATSAGPSGNSAASGESQTMSSAHPSVAPVTTSAAASTAPAASAPMRQTATSRHDRATIAGQGSTGAGS